MGRTVTIYFKDNKVSRVTGTKSKSLKMAAAIYGQSFMNAVYRGASTVDAQDVEAAVETLTLPLPPSISPTKASDAGPADAAKLIVSDMTPKASRPPTRAERRR